MRWFEQEREYYVIFYDVLSPPFEDVLNYCRRKLSLMTTLLLADKPFLESNIFIPKGSFIVKLSPIPNGDWQTILYIINLGLAKELCDIEHHWGLEGRPFGGINRWGESNTTGFLEPSFLLY